MQIKPCRQRRWRDIMRCRGVFSFHILARTLTPDEEIWQRLRVAALLRLRQRLIRIRMSPQKLYPPNSAIPQEKWGKHLAWDYLYVDWSCRWEDGDDPLAEDWRDNEYRGAISFISEA